MSKFYDLDSHPVTASVVGRDHVQLADGDRRCVLVRAAWKRATVNTIRTLCIDPVSALILRDVTENEDEKTGVRMLRTTVFTSFESNPSLPPDTFKFPILPGAVEVKPPV